MASKEYTKRCSGVPRCSGAPLCPAEALSCSRHTHVCNARHSETAWRTLSLREMNT